MNIENQLGDLHAAPFESPGGVKRPQLREAEVSLNV